MTQPEGSFDAASPSALRQALLQPPRKLVLPKPPILSGHDAAPTLTTLQLALHRLPKAVGSAAPLVLLPLFQAPEQLYCCWQMSLWRSATLQPPGYRKLQPFLSRLTPTAW